MLNLARLGYLGLIWQNLAIFIKLGKFLQFGFNLVKLG
jgi:hypothetical protein